MFNDLEERAGKSEDEEEKAKSVTVSL